MLIKAFEIVIVYFFSIVVYIKNIFCTSKYTLFMVSPETTKRVEVLLQMQELSVSHK